MEKKTEQSRYENLPYQAAYGKLSAWVSNLGLAILTVSFILYGFGIVEPAIPMDQLTQSWGLSIPDFVAKTGVPTGWQWVTWVDKGDFANLVGITLLVSVPSLCYSLLLFLALRGKKFLIAAMTGLTLVLMLLAASNLV